MPNSRLNPSISTRSIQGDDALAYVKGIGWSWEVDGCGIYCTPDEYKIVRDSIDNAGQTLTGNRWKTCLK